MCPTLIDITVANTINFPILLQPLLGLFYSEPGNSLWKRKADSAFQTCTVMRILIFNIVPMKLPEIQNLKVLVTQQNLQMFLTQLILPCLIASSTFAMFLFHSLKVSQIAFEPLCRLSNHSLMKLLWQFLTSSWIHLLESCLQPLKILLLIYIVCCLLVTKQVNQTYYMRNLYYVDFKTIYLSIAILRFQVQNLYLVSKFKSCTWFPSFTCIRCIFCNVT